MRRVAGGVLAAALASALPAVGDGAAQNPYPVPHASWASFTGRVAGPGEDEFHLETGAGEVLVTLEDWGWLDEALPLRPGEPATVHGRLDEALLGQRQLKADAIYLPERDAHYYAGGAGELSGHLAFPFLRRGDDGSWLTVTGTVQRVAREEFTLEAGEAELRVQTRSLPRDPAGWIRPGDRVSVSGEPGRELFESRLLRADSLARLSASDARD